MNPSGVMISPTLLRRLRRAAEAADRDFLTGLFNLRRYRRELARLLPRFRRGQTGPFALVLIDIQQFGALNEKFGHAYANMVLQRFANLLFGRLKSDKDFLARFGGDEFAGIVRLKNYEQLDSVLLRLRRVYRIAVADNEHELNVYAVGTLARRKSDADFIEGRLHEMLKTAKRAAHRK
ncbi:MAG: GGDEF domain-containing protein [Cyanobacteria bacterium]|nr:GGDEF domain-containing protein [Cyanobacteriota bacterium]